ncbi:LacI family DNA-binding transcriptional regulator [Rathayibacter festucae]|uniref:LacI family transcriptional regulator n=1 Tax=Rathayibacter festucae DSM 15932 TaxID=1328866 RepID=A0A3T0SZL8_9MICO|nr:LacI family DNA-binding transcriptional regulator [Rathayibacter festucae]AZZ51774.1 LacI family transcriptional regulator [Rathayibacter festucae DSM 15932]
MDGQRITLARIASEAGVSLSTVSKALSGTGRMRGETREHIEGVARRLGYDPGVARREVRTTRAYTIGLLTTDSFSRFAIPLMLGVEDALSAGQISVLLADGRGDPIRENHHLQTFLARRVDAVIVTGRRAETRPPIAISTRVPVCYVLARSQQPDDLSIVIDDEHGGRLAVSHLLALGRRRIAYISGPQKHLAARLRYAGMLDELAAAGVAAEDVTAMWGSWSEAWGRQAASILIRDGRPYDAVFCGSDQIARGVVEQLQEDGVRVPEDVSVVGFDNWDVMALASRPPLTTVDPRLDELGRLAAESVLAMLGGEQRRGVLPHECELVVRESTAVIPA